MGKLITLVIVAICLLGCSSKNDLDNKEREFILTKVNNYKGLISFYREQLSKSDTPEVRFKLCEVYNKIDDYESSQNCLKELINNSPTDKSLLLSAQNNSALGHNEIALKQIDDALKLNPKMGVAYNLKGVILAQVGDMENAKYYFESARKLFVAEEIVNNNLAMIAIIEKDYNLANSYLMPLYSRGYTSPQIVHNLIFTLVKLNDYPTAEMLIRQNNLENSAQQLIADLDSVSSKIPEPMVKTDISPIAKESDSEKDKTPLVNVTKPEKVLLPETKKTVVIKDNVKSISITSSDSASVAAGPKSSGEIDNVVIGDHGKFVRLVFISSSVINGSKLSGGRDNHVQIVIRNMKKNNKTDDLIKNIKKYTKTLNSISIEEQGNDLLLTFSAKRLVKQVKVNTLPNSSISNNRLVLDIIF
ncbi:tetratricopeptide repeat protein [Budvicia aquatica]|uniref:tetratricopeptide repeat protein n=1 Tax=Budvicia aquatica TaxID=82979 RepID=UPI002086D3DC|nr:hypothetical protein [Budvicia aquatica]GKX51708.1 hypothetical protein SOASR029_20170 [Budvicia aquatica]